MSLLLPYSLLSFLPYLQATRNEHPVVKNIPIDDITMLTNM